MISWIGNFFFYNLFIFILFCKFFYLFVVFTILIATITLIERKVLALVQRRVGPNYTGYKGRLQFISDAMKFILKHIHVLNYVNRPLYIILPMIILVISFLFWVNIIWGPNIAICEIEYNLFFLCFFSGFFSILILLVGFLSNNKYAILASTRTILINLNIEVLLGFLLILLTAISGSASFLSLTVFQ